jgi:hypothetical protein
VRRLPAIATAVLLSSALSLASAAAASAGTEAARTGTAPASQGQSGGVCIGRHPNPSAVWYTGACSGHDEPELDPVSSLPGSAQDLTWTAILPKDGTVPVSAVGPTFWWGGAVSDPNPHALFGQAFLELQFYPDSVVNTCSSDGGYNVTYAPNKFSVCSPVWQVSTQSGAENAAFNAELYDGSSHAPLVMNAGDTIQVHFFVASQSEGWNITVSDLTTGHSGTIVLNSKYGPLLPLFGTQQIGNALGWGLVDDTPTRSSGRSGTHPTSPPPQASSVTPATPVATPMTPATGSTSLPSRSVSVTFANGSTARQWAVVSDLGGTAEVTASCSSYGGPYCTYPWYAFNSDASAITFGADYPGTKFDYGQGSQYATTPLCGGPFGPDSTYCDTVLTPTP